MKDKQLEYFKKELNRILEEQQSKESVLSVKKSAFMINEICKSLFNPAYTSDALEVLKAGRGHLVPKQITTTNKKTGKTYTTTVWVNPNKQNGLKKYTEQDSKGAKIAIGKLMKKIDACNSVEELYSLVLRNKSRFSDNEGKPLPIVEKLHDCVEAKGSRLETQAKKKENAKKLTSSRSARLDGGAKKNDNGVKHSGEYVLTKSGKKDFGEITPELSKIIKRQAGKIRLRIGKQDGEKGDFGEKHIERDSRMEQLKAAGFNSARDFIEYVCDDFDAVYNNGKGLILAKKDEKKSKIAMIELTPSTDSDFYDVKTALISRNTYLEGKKPLWEKSISGSQSDNVDTRRVSSQSETPSAFSGQPDNASITDNANTVNNQSVKDLSENASSRLDKGVAEIRKHYEATKSVLGGKKSVILPNGNKIKCRYKIVEADAPTASHNEITFASSDNFPTNANGQNINDRDYQHDEDAKMSVISIGNNYNALALQDLPIVTKDGVVVSGNNRTMSSKLAAKNGRDKAYLSELKEQLADGEFSGLDENDLDGFAHPRLILEIVDEHEGKYTTEEFAQYNKDTKKTMNNVEKAVKLTKTLNAEKIQSIADSINGYETMGELYQDKVGGQEFVQKLIKAGIIGENEKAQFLQSDGLLNDTGKDFVETVLVGTILDENNIRGCDSEGGKSIRKKLLRAILPLVENKGNGKEYSFNKELNEAVSLILEVNRNKEFNNIDSYVKQQDMFGGGDFDPFAVQFAKILQSEGEKKFANRMKELGAGCRESASGAMDIFLGEVESKESLLKKFLDIKDTVKKAFDRFFAQWTA
mgnify:CR=1 FL=1